MGSELVKFTSHQHFLGAFDRLNLDPILTNPSFPIPAWLAKIGSQGSSTLGVEACLGTARKPLGMVQCGVPSFLRTSKGGVLVHIHRAPFIHFPWFLVGKKSITTISWLPVAVESDL